MSGRCRVAPAAATCSARRPLRFEFDGRRYQGLPGDTLASALLANGVHLVGRSFKYHRPRGHHGGGARRPQRAGHGAARCGALDAESERHAGRAVRRPRRRQPEPLALVALRCRRASTTCCHASFPRASTTRPSCGRARPGTNFYEPRIRAAAGWAWRQAKRIPITTLSVTVTAMCL